MFLSNVSIKRPYFASMINLVIIIFGLISFSRMGIDREPNVEFPYASVSVTYNGVNPKTSEEILLKPLEDALKGLQGLKTMYGSAFQGGASIFLEFNLDTDGDKAVNNVRNIISAVNLPKDAEKPIVKKIESNKKPIMELGITSKSLSTQEISRFTLDEIKPRLQRIEGVGDVLVYGYQDREIHINLNSSLLNAMQISPSSLKGNIENQILNKPSGTLRSTFINMGISTYSIPYTIDSIAKIPINIKDKPLIRIEDFSTVTNSLAEETSYSEYNGVKTISIAIKKESKGNILQIATNIKKEIEKLNKENTNKIEIITLSDDSLYIKDSFNAVLFDIILGAFLAVVVVFIFLHDWKNTFICSVAIPASLIGTFAVIHYLKFTLNDLTLLGLTLSIGILVDDAIVVIENIHRHKLMGKSAIKAAMDGSAEIGLAALAVTLAIVAVFVPIAFMEGIVGRYFYEFGITVATAVLISLFVAFTIVPMMSSKLLNENNIKKENKFIILFNQFFNKIQNNYQNILKRILNRKKTTILIGFIIFILSVLLLNFVPKTFQPDIDDSKVYFNFSLSQGTPLSTSIHRAKEIQEFIRKYPGVENVSMNVGAGETNSVSTINFTIMLVKPNKRNFTKNEFTDHITNDAKKFIRSDKEKIGSGDSYKQIQVNLISSNKDALNSYSKKLIEFINTIPEAKGATSSLQDPAYELRVLPNRLKAASFDVSLNDIADTIELLFKGVKVGNFYADGRFYDIKIMLPIKINQTMNDLTGVLVPNSKGGQVLLSSVATIEKVPIDPVIEHINGNNNLNVSADYYGKDLESAVHKIESFINKTIPFGVTHGLDGNSEFFKETIKNISSALLLAILFIFMVLCAQFENIKAPLSIMLSVPLAFSGTFLALLITNEALSIDSMIGIILLMGLVTKNAILLVEFAQQKMAEGMNVEEALLESAVVRFRPIMMTTLTMIAGMLPLILSSGAGSEARANMGIAVMGGLISSTILTLIIVPCAYSLLVGFKPQTIKAKLHFRKKHKLKNS
ncbi:MMPL family transporter [Silvanigrella paludirubra]|uniref:MMPL family transporter n=1 Tax=Silvanigrella paludirubra TaxID=2499159 RepID=A0A6N6VS94_9BACT|nr:efflux RND transporter permease subunit [Silvanigrella paludirubra]KAB8038977.1 MMPL family transporter [Silvanigrella paludirubra]